jgi:hypothetical protein
MNRFEYLNTNIERVKSEVKLGLISTSILRHYAIYSRYDYYRKLNNTVCLSVILTSENLNICQSGVFKIIKKMEEAV